MNRKNIKPEFPPADAIKTEFVDFKNSVAVVDVVTMVYLDNDWIAMPAHDPSIPEKDLWFLLWVDSQQYEGWWIYQDGDMYPIACQTVGDQFEQYPIAPMELEYNLYSFNISLLHQIQDAIEKWAVK